MAATKACAVGVGVLVLSLRAQAQDSFYSTFTSNLGKPYAGVAATIPGVIQAEKFDFGGQGVGYSDSTHGNAREDFRPNEDVDILSFETDSRFRVGWITPGEYLRYTVEVTEDVAAFDFKFRVSSPDGRGSFRVVSGGTNCDDYTNDLSGLVLAPKTGHVSHLTEIRTSPNSSNGGLRAGLTQIWLCAISTKFDIDYFAMTQASPISADDAFGGVPSNIPGTIQAEEFDWGGEGVGYSDSSPGNTRGAFRPYEGVDILAFDKGLHFRVGWITPGEYMRYTVNVEEDVAAFDFTFRVSSPDGRGSLRVVSGGTNCDDYTTDLSGLVSVPKTGHVSKLTDVTISGNGNGGLPSGLAHIWLCVVSVNFDIDSFAMTKDSTVPSGPVKPPATILEGEGGPFGGVAATVPGLIQAEEFDEGGEGVGYEDTTSGNKMGAFRPTEDVDIRAMDDGGYTVGNVAAGEYLRYTVDVSQKVDDVTFTFRLASAKGLGSLRVVTGGTGCDDYTTDLSGLVSVPSTGGSVRYQNLKVSSGGTGGLRAGKAYIWLCIEAKAFNIDSFTLSATASSSDSAVEA